MARRRKQLVSISCGAAQGLLAASSRQETAKLQVELTAKVTEVKKLQVRARRSQGSRRGPEGACLWALTMSGQQSYWPATSNGRWQRRIFKNNPPISEKLELDER